MSEQNIDDILNDDKEIDLESDKGTDKGTDVARALSNARKTSEIKDMKIPEQIALSFNMTYKELKEMIEDSDDLNLKREWTLYRESLKVKYALSDKETAKDMQANYQLGIESKSFPPINFYFGNDIREFQSLNVIMEQTKLQREKNAKEAEAMGIKVMSDEERREINEVLDDWD